VKKQDDNFGEMLFEMKKLLLPFAFFFYLSVQAQMKEGKIVYERVMQMPVRMINGDPELAAQIPKSRTDQYELLFGNGQSLWQYLPNAANEGDPNTFAGGEIVLRMAGGGNDMSYHNFEKGTLTDQREIAQQTYVVTDSIRKLEWKLTEETKTILGHSVHKAISQATHTRMRMTMENGEMKREPVQDTMAVVAWFAEDIPVPAGPGEYQGQLPGLILEMDINKSQTVFKAIEISSKVNKSRVKEPRDGKKMTATEFSKERDRLMEEMRKNMSGDMRIRMEN
jgi:GLPGLI family protein